jgi:hypothetical protein
MLGESGDLPTPYFLPPRLFMRAELLTSDRRLRAVQVCLRVTDPC